jgi:hypothetical protein
MTVAMVGLNLARPAPNPADARSGMNPDTTNQSF